MVLRIPRHLKLGLQMGVGTRAIGVPAPRRARMERRALPLPALDAGPAHTQPSLALPPQQWTALLPLQPLCMLPHTAFSSDWGI